MVLERGPALFPVEDQRRAAEAHKLRQFIDDEWSPQLAQHGEEQLGPLRAKLVGKWDTSACLLQNVLEQTCTMFDEEPELLGGSGAARALLEGAFAEGGYWGMARQHQQYVRGMHESLVYVSWDVEKEHPTFELVTPDCVTIDTAPSNRSRPMTIWRARQRSLPHKPNEYAWFWDRWTVGMRGKIPTSDGGEQEIEIVPPSFSIWSNNRKRDCSAEFGIDPAKWSGNAYPYRDRDGRPLLPFVLYHDRGSGTGVWAPISRSSGIVFGTLQVGLLWTAGVHGMLRASWAQRVLLNGKVKGGAVESGQKVAGTTIRAITPDPTSVLQVDGESPAIDEWGSPLDIEKAEKFCRMYEARLAVHFGLSPADLVIESLNPASGASITVSQAGKRAIAKRDLVHFRRGDLELIALVAAVLRAHGFDCDETGVRLRYHGVALTIDEREKVVRYVREEMSLGLMDSVAAYQELHPGTSAEDAQEDLVAMAERRRTIDVDAAPEEPAADGAAIREEQPDAPSAPAPDGPVVPADQPLAATALNGAQVTSAMDSIVLRYLSGGIPRESAAAALELFFQIPPAGAQRILGPASFRSVDTERVAELEAEVARLRAQLEAATKAA